jgi:outer membrane autotransporter protein
MNIESKARAGFTSIMLRGGRMTKWKGQVASYAPQVGHLQSVSVAAMAAALAFGGAMAVPSEAQAQDVTVIVDSGAPAPVAEVNNGDGALIIRATVPVTGVEATNATSATDLDIETDDITSPSNGVLATNNGAGLTSVNTTAGVVSATGGSGISVKTFGTGLDINAGQVSGSNMGISAENVGLGVTNVTATGPISGGFSHGVSVFTDGLTSDINVNVADVSSGEKAITVTRNGGGPGDINITSTGTLNSFALGNISTVGVDASIQADTAQGNINIDVANIVAGAGIVTKNFAEGGTSIASSGTITSTAGSGVHVVQGGQGFDVNIDVNDVNAKTVGIVAQNFGGGDVVIDAHDVTGGTGGISGFVNGGGTISITTTGTVNGGAGGDGIAVTAAAGQTLPTPISIFSASSGGFGILANEPIVNINVGTVTRGDNGIAVTNDLPGDTLITSTGIVTGQKFAGVSAINGVDAVNLTINLVDVEGNTYGVYAVNNGVGATVLSVTGTATGNSRDGIHAENNGSTGDLSVTANIVSGGRDGIEAINNGNGVSTIIINGIVDGKNGDGIRAINNGDTQGLSVFSNDISATASITGSNYGIFAQNEGSNGTVINVAGLVKGTASNGIYVYNGANTSTLEITANNVEGALDAIKAINKGTDNTTITLNGSVTGGAGYNGIYATNAASAKDLTITSTALSVAGAATVEGDVNGILAVNDGVGGSTTVLSLGKVVGTTASGIDVVNEVGTVDLSVTANDVEGALNAIKAINNGTGDTSVTLTGTATGGAGFNGINVTNDSTARNLLVNATKLAVADANGVVAATVQGGDNGILAVNNGTGFTTVKAAGKIVGTTGNGVEVSNAAVGTADPATGNVLSVEVNDVEGAQNGIFAINNGTGNALVKATGTVTGTGGNGISLANNQNGLDMTIEANNVTGGLIGISAVNNAKGATNVTATGTVTGQAAEGIRASNVASGTNIKVDALGDVSGNTAGILVDNDGSGFSLVKVGGNVTGGAAFSGISADNATTAKDLTITATNANATIEGGYNGIRAINRGVGGSTTVSAAGTVVGTSNAGIFASNEVNTLNLTVNANNVTGGTDGIFAENKGTGFTTVTASGAVTGGVNGNGIYATNAASAKDLTISSTALSVAGAATVQGGVNGILAVNDGVGGSTSVTAAGKVVGRSYNGIDATNNTGTVDLTITAADVSGASTGILALNYGSGATTVISTGTVTGTDEDGIVVYGSGAGDITVRSVNVSGEEGIDVTNFGNGSSTFITSTGNVEGKELNGIYAYNSAAAKNLTIAAVNVSGLSNGIFAENQGTGSTTITVSGNVTGGADDNGVYATNAASAKDLTINATKLAVADATGVLIPTILGGEYGILAKNYGLDGSTNITVAGAVVGSVSDGIRATNYSGAKDIIIFANSVTGGDNGIIAEMESGAVGEINVTALGEVIGTLNNGIDLTNDNASTNLIVTANKVTGGGTGVFVQNSGIGFTQLTLTGDVRGADFGISATNAATAKDLTINATNAAATITGGGFAGIRAVNDGVGGSTNVSSLGKVVGTTGSGVDATNEVDTLNLTVSANDVTGGTIGINASNEGTGSTLVKSTGLVSGANGEGILAVNEGTSLSIDATDVTGSADAIDATNNGSDFTSIVLRGNVTAGRIGVDVKNAATAKDVTIIAANPAAVITGANNGIVVNNSGKDASTSITVAGDVIGTNLAGINVQNNSGTANLTINAADVSGGTDGIYSLNAGTGFTRITTSGVVAGDNKGISANNLASASDLTINAHIVSGEKAIIALNQGTGSTSVRTTGLVTGTVGNAISVTNQALAESLAIDVVDVTANVENGIDAINNGKGVTALTVRGDVNAGRIGINVLNAESAKDVTIAAADIATSIVGANNGIIVTNFGQGASTSIAVAGSVEGTKLTGITVQNNIGAANLTISANNVKGGTDGIFAINQGTGSTEIKTSGVVEGVLKGISVNNSASAKDLTINAANVAGSITGGVNGILALNNGIDGSTTITAAGTVTGTTNAGISASNEVNSLNLTINANNVTGGTDGLVAFNGGKGATTLDAKGDIKGVRDGVHIENAATASTLTVSVKNVTGGIDGLDVINDGTGASTVSISGKVAGGTGVGVATTSKAGKLTTINLAATADVSATSGNAITNDLGDSVLNVANGAVITGTVRLGDGSDTANILLSSTAAFAGVTALDGGDNFAAADGFVDTLNLNGAGSFDLVGARVTNWELINFNAGTVGFSDALITAGALNVNNGATLNAANSLVATANVNVASNGTLLVGNVSGNSNARIVGDFTSAGLVNLSGTVGKAGDKLNVTANFTGANGRVRLDTVLDGDNSPTDTLNIAGNAIGSTLIVVKNVGGTGGLTLGDGIKLVQVGGKSDQTAFRLLDENVQAGGFRYGLFLGGIADPNDQDWYLRTTGLSDVAATTLSFARLSDDIAMTFLGTLHERVGEQEHLAKRGYSGGAMSGLWGRFVGKGFRERLSSRILGDVKSNGSITGLQMGLDIVRNIKGDGSATFAGIYAGHADGSSSDQNVVRGTARQSGTSKSDGWLAGIYGTHYAPSGWYANAVIQSNWLDAKAIGRNGTTLETDGRTWLGSVELGKALKLAERAEFETQVQLIYGNTKFDTALDSSGAENRVDIENSLIGRVGFRLKTTKGEKYNAEGGLFSGYLKANLWHNLSGADVELTNAGQSVGGFEPKKTWVDAGLGTTLTMSKNTELFFDADVEFGLDQKTTAGTGKVGLRINW